MYSQHMSCVPGSFRGIELLKIGMNMTFALTFRDNCSKYLSDSKGAWKTLLIIGKGFENCLCGRLKAS